MIQIIFALSKHTVYFNNSIVEIISFKLIYILIIFKINESRNIDFQNVSLLVITERADEKT